MEGFLDEFSFFGLESGSEKLKISPCGKQHFMFNKLVVTDFISIVLQLNTLGNELSSTKGGCLSKVAAIFAF